MTPSAQPPEETFCLTCGPDAALERHGDKVLHCPAAGAGTRLPALHRHRSQRHQQDHDRRAAAQPTARLRRLRRRRHPASRRARLGYLAQHLAPARPHHRAERPRDRPVRIADARSAGDAPRPQARRPHPLLPPRLPRRRTRRPAPPQARLARHLHRRSDRQAPAVRCLAAGANPALLRSMDDAASPAAN